MTNSSTSTGHTRTPQRSWWSRAIRIVFIRHIPVLLFFVLGLVSIQGVGRVLGEKVDAATKELHEIRVPPDNTKLFSILGQAVDTSEYEFNGTQSATTTPAGPFTDLPSNERTNAYGQQVTFHNVDPTHNL